MSDFSWKNLLSVKSCSFTTAISLQESASKVKEKKRENRENFRLFFDFSGGMGDGDVNDYEKG